MVWAGSPFARQIEFSTGLPTGAISYVLTGNNGAGLLSSSVTPAVGAISALIVIAGTLNTCATPLLEMRSLTWNYTTATGVVSDRVTYRVDKALPFTVSAQGVKSALGLADHELPDEAIDLVGAYSEFLELVGETLLAAAAIAGDRTTLLANAAIEALAALSVMPSLQLRTAQRESSGTNEFSRFSNIDWSWLRDELLVKVDRARAALDGAFDGEGAGGFMFGVATRTPDVITGS